MDKRIVMLAGRGMSTDIVYNSLKSEYNIIAVILEKPVDRKEFLKKRIKKLGPWKVFGQVIFQLFIVRVLEMWSSKRKKDILSKYGLENSPLPGEKVINVPSVNDAATINILKELDPAIVVVNGTRIISRQVLESIPAAVFINMHVGITPKYRGVHGGYWSLVGNDEENFGVTVHYVDTGIDTGSIIYQARASRNTKDNFVTYPLLQLAAGIPLLKKALKELPPAGIDKGKQSESRLWSHPTAWQYLYQRLFKGKK
jgi:folate-dependent phosphoribosylglycinamide formyltransferase PurN